MVVTLSVAHQLDPYLTLKALATYSGLSVTRLRGVIRDPLYPLPHHRVGGKILVRVSDFDGWMQHYRRVGVFDVDRIVDDAMRDLQPAAKRGPVGSGDRR